MKPKRMRTLVLFPTPTPLPREWPDCQPPEASLLLNPPCTGYTYNLYVIGQRIVCLFLTSLHLQPAFDDQVNSPCRRMYPSSDCVGLHGVWPIVTSANQTTYRYPGRDTSCGFMDLLEIWPPHAPAKRQAECWTNTSLTHHSAHIPSLKSTTHPYHTQTNIAYLLLRGWSDAPATFPLPKAKRKRSRPHLSGGTTCHNPGSSTSELSTASYHHGFTSSSARDTARPLPNGESYVSSRHHWTQPFINLPISLGGRKDACFAGRLKVRT